MRSWTLTTFAWVEHAMTSTDVPNWRNLPTVDIPGCPTFGCWNQRFMGGLSKTMRLTNVKRSLKRHGSNIVLFAVHCEDVYAVVSALDDSRAEWGKLCWETRNSETRAVTVFAAVDVDHVAAHIARAGGTPMFEDDTKDAHREIGVERLCRVLCASNQNEDDDPTCEEEYGLKRGFENWRFSWLPKEWVHVPITWDRMVQNVNEDPAFDSVDALKTLPNPLRNHVAVTADDASWSEVEWKLTAPATSRNSDTSTRNALRSVPQNTSRPARVARGSDSTGGARREWTAPPTRHALRSASSKWMTNGSCGWTRAAR